MHIPADAWQAVADNPSQEASPEDSANILNPSEYVKAYPRRTSPGHSPAPQQQTLVYGRDFSPFPAGEFCIGGLAAPTQPLCKV